MGGGKEGKDKVGRTMPHRIYKIRLCGRHFAASTGFLF